MPAPAWPDQAALDAQQSQTGVRCASHIWTSAESEVRARWPNMPARMRTRADFEHLINGYDGAIRGVDAQLGRVFAALQEAGVWDETAIIISADHGEAFGELGQYMEHGSASPTVHHVPLIVRWPGLTPPAIVCDDLIYSLDLAPTVCQALGLDAPAGWSGRSLVPQLRGENDPHPRERLVLSHGLHCRQRTVFDGRWAFVRTYEPSYYEYSPRMLFDLESDPHQTRDLAPQMPARVAEMEAYLLSWERAAVEKTGLPDPMRAISDIPVNVLGGVEAHLAVLRAEGRDKARAGTRSRCKPTPVTSTRAAAAAR